jgi:prepilin-type N-terminal cleavage/methylation domain-containing protein
MKSNMLKKIYQNLKKNKNFNGQNGYTLVELLITIVVIATSFAAFAVGLSTGALAVNEDDKEVTAQNLARSQMEYIKYLAYDQNADTYPTIDTPDGYDITVTVTDIDTEGNKRIQKVTADLYKDGILLLTIEDYKVDR